MSLVDILLANRMILLVVGFAALLLVAALLIALAPNIKPKRKKKKARKPEAVEAEQADGSDRKARKGRSKRKRGKEAPPASGPAAPTQPTQPAQASAAAARSEAQGAVPAGQDVSSETPPAGGAPEAAPDQADGEGEGEGEGGGEGAETPQAEEKPGEPEDKASAAVQSILDGVFEDEDQSARLAALLEGLDPVDISALLSLAQQVAGQLHGPGMD
jgi:predicted lipid-binding transport protein (Tim44 family)